MFDYAGIATNARKLLVQFGAVAYVRRNISAPVYDPATGLTSQPVDTDLAVDAVAFDYDEHVIDGQRIQIGDKQAFAASKGPDGVDPNPQPDERFVWVDGVYTIIKVKKLAPAGLNVLYELQVRK